MEFQESRETCVFFFCEIIRNLMYSSADVSVEYRRRVEVRGHSLDCVIIWSERRDTR